MFTSIIRIIKTQIVCRNFVYVTTTYFKIWKKAVNPRKRLEKTLKDGCQCLKLEKHLVLKVTLQNNFRVTSKLHLRDIPRTLWIIPSALSISLREKCPNTGVFLVRIFLYSNWIRKFTQISVFSPNTEKHGPGKAPYLDNFHAVSLTKYENLRFLLIYYSNELTQRCIRNVVKYLRLIFLRKLSTGWLL